ncbi:MAG: gephyrin-like molybdotransferase Glp [Enterocloster sp.]|nr:gephyrin-like molybdotransferase Glp [Enterocloster sp.]
MRISLEQALNILMDHVTHGKTERKTLEDCLGLVLSEDVYALLDMPPFSRSAQDGYALCSKDSIGATGENPVKLKVTGKIYAGDHLDVQVRPGEAVRIMTGAMVPAGADCVLRQEDTDEGEDVVQIYKEVEPGCSICFKGEEYKKGHTLLHAGTKIDAAALAVASGNGIMELPVYRRVKAAVVSSGSEVVEPGTPLTPGKIYNTNTIYMKARLSQLGARVMMTRTVGDDLEVMAEALKEAADQAELVVTTGGVSVGQKDLTEEALLSIGAKILFHGIAIKPGMPTLAAEKDGVLFIGLSGNPFSAAIPFEMFVREILSLKMGDPDLKLRRETLTAVTGFSKDSRKRRFLRGKAEGKEVWLPDQQANGQMRSMVGCNCLIEIPAGSGPVKAGDKVEVLWL